MTQINSNAPIIRIQVEFPPEFFNGVRDVVRTELANYTPPPPQADSPEYLTRKETAKLLRISLVTLHEWVKEDVIRSFEINRCIRFRREDVLNLVKDVDTLKYKSKK